MLKFHHSNNADCDADESGEPDCQEAGCFPKLAKTILVRVEVSPEMPPGSGFQKWARVHARWRAPLLLGEKRYDRLHGDCAENARAHRTFRSCRATDRFDAFYKALQRHPQG